MIPERLTLTLAGITFDLSKRKRGEQMVSHYRDVAADKSLSDIEVVMKLGHEYLLLIEEVHKLDAALAEKLKDAVVALRSADITWAEGLNK